MGSNPGEPAGVVQFCRCIEWSALQLLSPPTTLQTDYAVSSFLFLFFASKEPIRPWVLNTRSSHYRRTHVKKTMERLTVSEGNAAVTNVTGLSETSRPCEHYGRKCSGSLGELCQAFVRIGHGIDRSIMNRPVPLKVMGRLSPKRLR